MLAVSGLLLVSSLGSQRKRANTFEPDSLGERVRARIADEPISQERATQLVSQAQEWAAEHTETLAQTGRAVRPDRAWAEQAARTMTTEAASQATQEVVEVIRQEAAALAADPATQVYEDERAVLEMLGGEWSKIWISRGDSRVRSLHRKLHGQPVPTDEHFWRWPLTGKRLAFPGDPAAPIGERINCRCMLFYVPAEVEASSVVDALGPSDLDESFDLVATAGPTGPHSRHAITQAELDMIHTLLRSGHP